MKYLHRISVAIVLCTPYLAKAQSEGQIADSVEIQALEDLYYSTNGATWKNSGGWLEGATISEAKLWHGVRVENNDVVGISLKDNDLNGNIPESIGSLKSLNVLDLSHNDFERSPIPNSLGSLDKLKVLNLMHSKVGGEIPESLGNLKELKDLNLSLNYLEGHVPPSLEKLKHLKAANLNNNKLAHIPEKLKRFKPTKGEKTFDEKILEKSYDIVEKQNKEVIEPFDLPELKETSLDYNEPENILEKLSNLKDSDFKKPDLNSIKDSDREILGDFDKSVIEDGFGLEEISNESVPDLTDLNELSDFKKFTSLYKIDVPAAPDLELPAMTAEDLMPQLENEIPPVPGDIHKNLGFDNLTSQLKKEDIPEMPQLRGGIIKQNVSHLLDSIRSRHLKQEKLKFKEKEITEKYKEGMLKKRESLFKKSFFDGIVGINNNFNTLNISPAYGLQLNRKLSIGLGLNMGIDTRSKTENVLLGIRSFGRYEVLKKKIYLQIEDNSYLPEFSYLNWADDLKRKSPAHVVLVGAGYLFNYSSTKSLNLAFLYQVNERKFTSEYNAPVIMRLGFNMYHKK